MAFIRYKQRNDKWYAYKIVAFWDSTSKKPKQKTTYLRVASSKGGEIIKAAAKCVVSFEKGIVDFGDSYIVTKVAENEGLQDVLKISFENFDTIMALICYQITAGAAMYNAQDWIEGNVAKMLFPKAKLRSQDISRLINYLGRDDIQSIFFKHYIEKFFKGNHGILIDSTSLPSSINSSLNNWGHSSDGIDQKVGCLMLVDKNSKLPLYFRAIPGEIADVSTLKITLDQIIRLGLKPESAVLDAGYFSEDNIIYLCETGINFVTRMPKSRKQFKLLIDEIGNIEIRKNAVKYGKRTLFIKNQEIKLYNQTMFAHEILDPYKKAKDIEQLISESFENKESEEDANVKMKYCGYLVLISRFHIEKEDVLPTYYSRQLIEQIFGFAKSSNNVLPLRVHSNQSIQGYLLLVFLSLIVFVMMRQKLQSKFTVEQALLILRNVKAKVYDTKLVVMELNKKAKDITKLFNIIMPTSVGI